MSPLVSIIVPVYNTEMYLGECLESLLNQSYQNLEIICVNDGSPDNSREILDEYARRDARIIVLNQENAGPSAARNAGLDVAQGDYIMFVDSDDTIHLNAVEIFYTMLEETQSEIAVSNDIASMDSEPVSVDSCKWSVYEPALKYFVKMRKARGWVCNKLYRVNILKDIRFITGILFEDWPFVTTLFSDIKRFVATQAPLYFYRINDSSTVHSGFSAHKIDSFATGVRYVAGYKKDANYQSLVASRLLQSVTMCINKTYRDKVNRHYLASHLCKVVGELHQENLVSIYSLPLKTQMRYLMLRYFLH